jgi:hypothetical protein|nr:MAG TPA: hypothetical protein [Caudoviricetes sp.]
MRLIDADKLIKEMSKWYWDKEKQKAAEEDASPMDLFTHLAITTVQEQPTAFDVNLIVKKLEEEKTIAYDDSIDEKIRVRLWNKAIGNAIKIVEGGINE